MKEKIDQTLKKLVELLVVGDYSTIFNNDYQKRISVSEIESAIGDYGGVLTFPPDSAYLNYDIFEIEPSLIKVEFDLWFDGNKSDLTFMVSFLKKEDEFYYAIEDIHVL